MTIRWNRAWNAKSRIWLREFMHSNWPLSRKATGLRIRPRRPQRSTILSRSKHSRPHRSEAEAGSRRRNQGRSATIFRSRSMIVFSVSWTTTSNGRGRSTIELGLERVGRYQPMIEQILKEEGVPLDLIYLCQAESAFQPRALSRAKAKGMWQFISVARQGIRTPADLVDRRAVRSGKIDSRSRTSSERSVRGIWRLVSWRWPPTTPVRSASSARWTRPAQTISGHWPRSARCRRKRSITFRTFWR